jgi:hypothetical protein
MCFIRLALLFKGLHGPKHFIAELKHIITPTKLVARPGVVRVTICIYMYTCSYNPAFLVLYSYFSWWVWVCVCVPAYWPRRMCGGKWGAEERWSMGAWRVAAEGSWWSTATRTTSCLSTHPSRSCTGKFSKETAATSSSTCVSCGAGERNVISIYSCF